MATTSSSWQSGLSNNWSQNQYDPWVSQGGQNLFGGAQNWLQNNPWQNYSGPLSASFGPQFGQASNYLSGQLGQTNPYTQEAGGAFGSVLGAINPNASVSDYMSQYVGQALQPTLQNINQAAAQQSQQNNANATMAGSYGGTASGVLQGLLDKATQQNIAGATGNAYNQAFQQAQQAKLGNLNALNAAGQGLLGTGQSAFGQGTTLASLLAGLGSQQQQAGQTGIQNALNQSQLNQTMPLQRFNMLSQLLGMLPKNTTSQTAGMTFGQGQQQQPQPNLGMGLLGSLFGSLFR